MGEYFLGLLDLIPDSPFDGALRDLMGAVFEGRWGDVVNVLGGGPIFDGPIWDVIRDFRDGSNPE